jgi:hypothetical protein
MFEYVKGPAAPDGPDYVNMTQWGLAENKRLNPSLGSEAIKAEHSVAATERAEREQTVEGPAPEPQKPTLQFYEDRAPEKSREPEAPQAEPTQEKEGQKLQFFEDKYRTLRIEHSRSVDR